MEPGFHPAVAAVKAGDLERFRTLLRADPSLATARSSKSHPTLLQCQDSQDIIDNAFVYACMGGQIAAAERLLQHGARINAIPPGFDYAGTGLQYAAMQGHRPLVEYLLAHGADPRSKSRKVQSTIHHTDTTAAGWAEHGGHPEIRELLEQAEKGE